MSTTDGYDVAEDCTHPEWVGCAKCSPVDSLRAVVEAVEFEIDGDGDNRYADDRYGTGAVVICTDVIRAAIASVTGGAR